MLLIVHISIHQDQLLKEYVDSSIARDNKILSLDISLDQKYGET